MEVLIISKKLNKLALMMAGVLAAASVAAYAAVEATDKADINGFDSGVLTYLGEVNINARTTRMDAWVEADTAGTDKNLDGVFLYLKKDGTTIYSDGGYSKSRTEAYVSEKGTFSGEYEALGKIYRNSGTVVGASSVYAEATY